ncbi:MAG: FAD-dependent oxidoreductase [Halobacteriota archaeon]
MVEKVVIIGGGAAGIDVLELLLRGCKDPGKMKITLLKKEDEGFFSMCGLPYALQGMYSTISLNLFEPDFYIDRGIDFRTSAEVTGIFLKENYVLLSSGERLYYDFLVIATGSSPFIPPIKGANMGGVYTIGNSKDGKLLEKAVTEEELENALVIGGGLIGLQTAAAFSKKGITTRVVERRSHLLPSLIDKDMASIIKKYLDDDLIFLLGTTVDVIKGSQHVESVNAGGDEFPADIVLIAAGMLPNIDISRKAGLEIGESGGIVTDLSLRVKKGSSHLENVYALGDCIEVIDAMTYRPRLSLLASTALTQARVVVRNILGEPSYYEPCLSPSAANILGMQVGSVGATSEIAHEYGIPTKVGKSVKQTRARFFPGGKVITAKLIFEAFSEKLIGAQIISQESVAERINELTLGIKAGITAKDIWMRDRCFDPSLSMLEDVIVDAALNAVQS